MFHVPTYMSALMWLLAFPTLLLVSDDGGGVAEAAQSEQQAQNHAAQGTDAEQAKFEQDRKAILAMAGEYKVTFQFKETVAVEPGYEPKEPYHAEANELVQVIEDAGDFISLQHILMVHEKASGEDHVVKHWRQDWRYQDTEMNVFRGNDTWEHITLSPAEVVGTWSQAVYQVDDSPRYESLGKWVHTGARSAWDSQETWRPLPRREYTHRYDYDVVVARNRHTITPTGWVHEQDNYKLVIDKQGNPVKVLVHETGLNVYDRVDDADFTAGREYWEATRDFWRDARAAWSDVLNKPGKLKLLDQVDGKSRNRAILSLADQVKAAGKYDADKLAPLLRQTIASYVQN